MVAVALRFLVSREILIGKTATLALEVFGTLEARLHDVGVTRTAGNVVVLNQ